MFAVHRSSASAEYCHVRRSSTLPEEPLSESFLPAHAVTGTYVCWGLGPKRIVCVSEALNSVLVRATPRVCLHASAIELYRSLAHNICRCEEPGARDDRELLPAHDDVHPLWQLDILQPWSPRERTQYPASSMICHARQTHILTQYALCLSDVVCVAWGVHVNGRT